MERRNGCVYVIPVAKTIQRISISPDGSHLFTHDQDAARLAVIDIPDGNNPDSNNPIASFKVIRWIELPDVAYASAPTPDGKWLLVACPKKHLLLATDMTTLRIAKSFDLPGSRSEILVRPDSGVVFVSCMDSGKIAAVDLHAWQIREPIVPTTGVDGLAWAPTKNGRESMAK